MISKTRQNLSRLFNIKVTGEQLYLISFIYCTFFLFIFTTTFSDYFHTRPLQLISYIGLGLVIVKIYLFDHLNWKQLMWTTGIILVSVVSWRNSQSNTESNLILYMTIFVLGARNVHFRKIVSYFYKTGLIMLILIMLYSMLGIISNLAYFTPGRPVRYSLGMVYPTDMASHILFLILAKCYLVYPKIKWYHYVTFLLLAFFIKVIADARLSFYVILLLVLVMMIAQQAQKGQHIFRMLASLYWTITPITVFISVITVLNFDMSNHIMRKVNDLLSGRLLLGSQAVAKYGIGMWGKPVVEHGSGGIKGMHQFFNTAKYFYIDSSFIRLLVIYGVAMFFLVIFLIMFISIRSTVCGNYILPAILLIVTISCLIEQHLLDLSFDPFLLSLLAINDSYSKSEEIKYHEKSCNNYLLQQK